MRKRIHRTFHTSPFTLIEMLVVLAIMVIIVGMSVGVVSALNTHKGPDGAARTLTRMIQLARQSAISENRRVALVLARKGDVAGSGDFQDEVSGLPTNECGIFMRPCIVDTSNAFVEYVKDSRWEYVPDRTVFVHDNTNFGEVDITELNGGSDVPALIFRPNGSLISASNVSLEARSISSKDLGGQFLTYYRVDVNWLTGRTTISKQKD